MAAQLTATNVIALGIPQVLQAFSTVSTHLNWNIISRVHLPLKWESAQAYDRSYTTKKTEKQLQEIREFPSRVIGILLLNQFPFHHRPELLDEMVTTIYSEIKIILNYADQVGIVLNVPHDQTQENSGYEALNIALLSSDYLSPQLKEKCKFLEPIPEPENARPFQRLRNKNGHLLEGVQIYYTRQVLSSPEFSEFLNLELAPLTRPHNSLKRKKMELDSPSSTKKTRDSRSRPHGSPSPRDPEIDRPSTSKRTRDSRSRHHGSPSPRPSSLELESRVTLLRLKEAQQNLDKALKRVSVLQNTVGELRGERKVLKRLVRKGDTYKDAVSSSSSDSSSDSSEDSDDAKGGSDTEQKESIRSNSGSPRREWN